MWSFNKKLLKVPKKRLLGEVKQVYNQSKNIQDFLILVDNNTNDGFWIRKPKEDYFCNLFQCNCSRNLKNVGNFLNHLSKTETKNRVCLILYEP